MMAAGQLFSNNAVSLLGSDISDSDLIIQLPNGYGELFPLPSKPHEYFLVTLESVHPPLLREIIKVKSRVGDVLYIDADGRGLEDTSARSWTASETIVDHRITADTLRKFHGPWGESSVANVIDMGHTESVNAIDISAQNKTCKWIITIQTADNRVCMSEIIAVYKPSGPIFSQFAKVGDRIAYNVDVVNIGTLMVLNITNTDISQFSSVDIIRLQHYT